MNSVPSALAFLLMNVGHTVCRGTIRNVLQREGIEPAQERGSRTPWSVFLKAHCRTLMAADFFTAEVWTAKGLITYYVFFVIDLAKQIVHIAGMTTRPNDAWMMQVGRNLTDSFAAALSGKSHLILDRDTKYSRPCRRLIAESGTAIIRLPPRLPNLNAYAVRFVRSIKDECLNRMILVWQSSLCRAINEYIMLNHAERNHQGIENRLIRSAVTLALSDAHVQRRQQLVECSASTTEQLHSGSAEYLDTTRLQLGTF